MRSRRTIALLGLAAPVLLLQLDLTSCFGPLVTEEHPGGVFNLPPTVLLTADVSRGVAPLTVRFDSAGSTDDGVIVQRKWDFGDGQTSQDIAPRHIFQTNGQFTARLTLTDDEGASATRSVIIVVTSAPVAVLDVDRESADSAPATFNFDASKSYDPDGAADDVLRYRWDFGDGTREVLPRVPHTFASAGTFRVVLTITDAHGIQGKAERYIEVGIPRPTITFRAPSSDITNLVVSPDSPLWLHTVFNVQAGVPYHLRAGLDGDRDACNSQVVLYSVLDGSLVYRLSDDDGIGHRGPVRAAAYAPNGDFVVSVGEEGTARVYDTEAGTFICECSDASNPVNAVAISPDSMSFVLGYTDGRVVEHDAVTCSQLRIYQTAGQTVNALAYSPDGGWIAAGDNNGSIWIWSTANPGAAPAELAPDDARAVTSLAYSATDPNTLLSGSIDQVARLWQVNPPLVKQEFAPVFDGTELVSGHANRITSVALSKDGAYVLTGSDDTTAKLWNADTGQEIRTFSSHSDRVTAVAFAADGKRAITGSADQTARIWTLSDGSQYRVLQPCASPIAAVAFAPDGSRVLVGVAARNDIQLDTTPPSGNDLNLTVPTALSLSGVTTGAYYLWAEVDTDRSNPSRSYAAAAVNVIPRYTRAIDSFTPRVPFSNDRASIVVAPTPTTRQVFDLGPLREGDRLFLSLLSAPGYGAFYEDDRYSLMILDAEQSLYAWYQDGFTLFTPDAKLIVGHNSAHYYMVVDTGHSVDIRVQRNVGVTPRQQRVLVDFSGATRVFIADQPGMDLPRFDAKQLNPAWGGAETAIIKNKVMETLQALFTPYDIVFYSSDDNTLPAVPYQTVYVGGADPYGELFGIADYIDPRNETLTGEAAVYATTVAAEYPEQTAEGIGSALGALAAHEIGHMLGLRHTDAVGDVMCPDTEPTDESQTFRTGSLVADEQYATPAIGTQNAPQLLKELLGIP